MPYMFNLIGEQFDAFLLALRNDLVMRSSQSGCLSLYKLLRSEMYQECLDALDPEAPGHADDVEAAIKAYRDGLSVVSFATIYS